MISLLRYFSWRHNRRHLLRAMLGLSSIALGIGLFVSFQFSQNSTVAAFEKVATRMAGKAELQVMNFGLAILSAI